MALATRLQSRLWRPSGSKVPVWKGSSSSVSISMFSFGHPIGEEIVHLEHDLLRADVRLEIRGPVLGAVQQVLDDPRHQLDVALDHLPALGDRLAIFRTRGRR